MKKTTIHKSLIAHLKTHKNANHPHGQEIIKQLEDMTDNSPEEETPPEEGSDAQYLNERDAKSNRFTKMASLLNEPDKEEGN